MQNHDLVCKIALGLIPGVGDINARKLVSATGSVEAVFREPYGNLIKIPGIGDTMARSVIDKKYLAQAEKEAAFVTSKKITTLFYLDDDYPQRLKECTDSPVMIYYLGNGDLDAVKMLSIVGTRKATTRGKDLCEDLVSQLAAMFPDLVIVSGLAYGIDITAHKAALNNGIKTVAVLAHGLRTIYPPVHTAIARKMVTRGGLLTDFISDAPAEKNNFLKRNRIIAGLSPALLVVESGVKGGALVTAEMALSYNRDVMATPGRPTDNWSGGCNRLIKRNIAALVENASDICEFLNWAKPESLSPKQPKLFENLDKNESDLLRIISCEESLTIDQISQLYGQPVNKISSVLLSLELKGAIKCCPGNAYIKCDNVIM
ncbi:MAG: DNA-processing protein DprA [Bacteroidales bacterium]